MKDTKKEIKELREEAQSLFELYHDADPEIMAKWVAEANELLKQSDVLERKLIADMRERAARIRECAVHADRNEDMNRELEGARKLEIEADDLERKFLEDEDGLGNTSNTFDTDDKPKNLPFLIVPEYVKNKILAPSINIENIVLELIDNAELAKENTTGLVYPSTDEGKKLFRANSVVINKFVKEYSDYNKAIFDYRTVNAKNDSNKLAGLLVDISNNNKESKKQFDADIDKRLEEIKTKLNEYLQHRYEVSKIQERFKLVDITPLIKLTGTLTTTGNLTNAAKNFITSRVQDAFALQTRAESRRMIIENRCLKHDIKIPLTGEHFGEDLYADDEIFDKKLDDLIAIEVTRMALIRQANQEEITKHVDEALEKERTSMREQEKDIQKEPGDINAQNESLPINESTDISEPVKESVKKVVDFPIKKKSGGTGAFSTKKVHVTVDFFITVGSLMPLSGVIDYFQGLLPEKLRAACGTITVENAE